MAHETGKGELGNQQDRAEEYCREQNTRADLPEKMRGPLCRRLADDRAISAK